MIAVSFCFAEELCCVKYVDVRQNIEHRSLKSYIYNETTTASGQVTHWIHRGKLVTTRLIV